MSPAWQAFGDELALWRDSGRSVDFWWRDDDAGRPAPALERLIGLAQTEQVPLALAVVAQEYDAAILQQDSSQVVLLQHGVDHHNRGGEGGKKTEFAATEPVAAALERLRGGCARIALRSPGRMLPVLVPPWNRIASAGLLAALPAAGYSGLSRFGPRDTSQPLVGLCEVNTHVDIIDWRGSRGFAGEEMVLAAALAHLRARRTGLADLLEPTGWLTHHAVHDAPSWDFLRRLFERTRLPWVRWVRPDFSGKPIFYTANE